MTMIEPLRCNHDSNVSPFGLQSINIDTNGAAIDKDMKNKKNLNSF